MSAVAASSPAAKDFSAFAGQDPFLDGHVYVVAPKPGLAYELLVLGDLHGCYSCLKAALMQADFFAKVQAHHDDPEKNPRMMLVFLGDYIDRGRFSYNGILRTVMQLFVDGARARLRAPRQPRVLPGAQRPRRRARAPIRSDDIASRRRADRGVRRVHAPLRGDAEHAGVRSHPLRARGHPARGHARREVAQPHLAQRPRHPLSDVVERSQRRRPDPARAPEGERSLSPSDAGNSSTSWLASA